MADLTQARLKELIDYEPVTGRFTWREPRRNVKVGWPAGRVEARGYVQISIFDRHYYAHRLAWLYMTGAWPKGVVDHINGIKNDNRWLNLRDAGPSVNQQNLRGPTVRNVLGYLGVIPPQGKRKKFKATIQVNGKSIHLGYHKTAALAHGAYLTAKRQLHAGGTL